MNIFNSRMTLLFLFCFFSVIHSTNVLAYPGGVSGYSGFDLQQVCSPCHAGSTLSSLILESNSGSNTVVAGSTSSYTLSLTGGTLRGGLDVSTTGGDLVRTANGTKIMNSELTHSSPRPLTNGTGSWSFNWLAPEQAGTYTIYAAAISSDGENYHTGTTTLNITVTPGSGNPQTPPGGDTSSGGGGGGGCTIKPNASFDPLLPFLVIISCMCLFLNRKRKKTASESNSF